jgi:nucleotide-binding universal stress UspA family protein
MLPPKVLMSPIDFSEHSQDALNSAIELARCFGSELLLVHVVPAIPKLPSPGTIFHEAEYEEELHKNAKNRLEEMVRKISGAAVRARSIVGTANDVSMELLRIAEHNDVDLIVIATHGMSGWHKLAFGSVTEKVVRLASCPVMVLRVHQEQNRHENSQRDSVEVSQ